MIYQGKQKIWADYQKEIPDDHWFYVRSCIRQNFFPGAERMFLEICRGVLGKDFHETASHTTCGGIAYHCDTIPQETVMTIVARQFALMTEAGYENYVTSCITRSATTSRYSKPGTSSPNSRPRYASCSGKPAAGNSRSPDMSHTQAT